MMTMNTTMTNNRKTPCRDCERREVGCHSKCEDYLAFVKKNEIVKINRAKENIFLIRKRRKK